MRRSLPRTLTTAVAGGCLAALTLLGASTARADTDVSEPATSGGPQLVVAQDGSGDHTSVQAAVDAAPPGADIVIEPGVYREVIRVDRTKRDLSFLGATGDPADVVLTYDNASGTPRPGGGTYGTTGSASVTLAGDGFTARGITFENAFDEQAHPEITSRQAVAVKTTGDRIVFDDCRFLGNQDTLYLDSPNRDTPARVYVHDSWIEGDVDFIFGRATAVIDQSTIKALHRDSTPNGYVTAPSTAGFNPYGFLIANSRLISNAKPGTYYLGRPWHPGGDATASPQIVIRESFLGHHVNGTDPWTTMSGFDWDPGRFAEYGNVGPGADVSDNRPQLTGAEAADHEAEDYLAGDDGWNPVGGED